MELSKFNFNGDENVVIINEQHNLKPQQEELLIAKFKSFIRFDIPAEGLNEKEMEELAIKLSKANNVIIASPIPYLCKLLGLELSKENKEYYVFHNDERNKEEINGRIIFKLSDTGWKIK